MQREILSIGMVASMVLGLAALATPAAAAIAASVAVPTAATSVIASDPIGEWRLDETSGVAVSDRTGHGHAGALANGASWTRGHIDGAVSLDGVDDYVSVPDHVDLDGMDELVVSVWTRLDELPATSAEVVGKNGAGGNSYRLGIDATGRPSFAVQTTGNAWNAAGTVAVSSKTVAAGAWHHLIGSYDGERVRVYLDGVLTATSTAALSGSIVASASPLRFGFASGSSVEALDGSVDEVRVYADGLSEVGARNLYRSYTQTWRPAEIQIEAANDHADPYRDLDLAATFTGPGGQELTMPGFWDGGDTWRVRFAPPAPGVWSYVTSSTDTSDAGLHDRTGEVVVGAYTGAQGIYTRGFLQRGDGARYLEYRDGTPFFWAAETHTFGLSREQWSSSTDPSVSSQFRSMVDAAARDGFSVYQTGLFIGELGDAGGTGTSNEGGYAWGSEGFAVGSSSAGNTEGFYNTANKGFDGNVDTAWYGASSGTEKLFIDLAQDTDIGRITTTFDFASTWRYRLEGSTNGVTYYPLADKSAGVTGTTFTDTVTGHARYVRVVVLGNSAGSAPGIAELEVFDSSNELLNNRHKWGVPNVEFWRDVDRRIQYVADRGLVTAISLDWGRELEPATVADHKRVARYAVARLGAFPMVWMTAGEYAQGDDAAWGQVAAYTRSVDPHAQPVTLLNTDANIELFRGESWYDLIMLQGAHDARRSLSHWLTPYDASPAVPVLEAEIDFETILGIPSYYTREDAYRSFMAGSFGFSYGAEGIWNAVTGPEDSFQMWGKEPRPWYQSRELPFRQQMKYYTHFFTGIEWWKLQPNSTAVTWGPSAATSGIRQPFQKAAADGSLVVAYLPSWGSAVTGVVNGLSPAQSYQASWFNTRNGVTTPIGSAFAAPAAGTWAIPAQPDVAYDWVLLVERVSNKVGRPSASAASGVYATPQSVTLTSATSGAAIRYTLDGSVPTASSPLYSGPIPISANATLRAVATKTGMIASSVSSTYFRFEAGTVAAPASDKAGGTYAHEQVVTLTSSTPGATIYYTVDGTTPTTASTVYEGPVAIERTLDLRAIAVRDGYRSSAPAAWRYRIQDADQVALGARVRASSGANPQQVVDGDPLTSWAPDSSQGEWLTVDLGRQYEVAEVDLRFRSSAGYFYRVQVSRDNIDFETVVDKSQSRTDDLGLLHAYDFESVTARYVRFQLVSVYEARSSFDAWLSELRVYGVDANLARESAAGSETNLVFGKPMRSSASFSNSSSGGRFAGDANTTTSWQAASGTTGGQWVEVDFESPQTFNSARLMEFGNRTTGYRIEYWSGGTWLTAYTGTTIGTANQYKTVRFSEVTGTRARIYFTSTTSQPILYEFQLFHRADGTSASSTYDDETYSRLAFDGNSSTSWQGVAGSYANQWLERDFGTPTAFNTVEISERGDRTTGFRIEYWDGSAWQVAFTGTQIGDQRTVTFSTVTAQKVRLFFTGGLGQPMIHEFQVFQRSFSASSVFNDDASYAPERAFDSSATSAWQADVGQFVGSWLRVDFGNQTVVNGASLSEFGARTTGYRLEYWDGDGWQTAHTGTGIGASAEVAFPAVTTSRMRLFFTGGTSQPIIYSFLPRTSTGDLSAGVAATASTHRNVNHTPDKSVDRASSTYWSASDGAFPQWLLLDLGSVRQISSITQTFLNSTTWRYKLETSRDGVTYTTWTDQTTAGAAGAGFYHPGEAEARYVRLVVAGSSSGDWATSKELIVQGR